MIDPLRAFRRFMNRRVIPGSLMGRSFLIVVLPIVILQLIITVIFYNRHWDTVTRWLASGVASEVSMIVELLETRPEGERRSTVLQLARRHFDLAISFEPDANLKDAVELAGFRTGFFTHIDKKILEAFAERLTQPYALDLRSDNPSRIAVYVQLDEGVLRVLANRRRVTATTTWLLLTWMIGASTVLTLVALHYMRLQVRPIRRLARAVDRFGKGRDTGNIHPEGPAEIKLAARAFNLMRERINRYVAQRTEMLAAVSHDLRTPLTRMKLELELLDGPGDDPVFSDLRQDVEEMQQLVEAYLAFARGEGREAMRDVELSELLLDARDRAARHGAEVEMMDPPLGVTLHLRPGAIKRALANLVDNASRYGKWIGIGAVCGDQRIDISIEDDGPGIPVEQREAVMQAFVRLETSRSRDTGGLGLGLSIVRDIVLSHGGELILTEGSRGGLKAIMRMPV